MDYTAYAASVDAKTDLSKTTENRYRLWEKAFRPLLPRIRSSKRILDYGCGGGEFLDFLSRNTDAELTGYDLSASQRERAEKLCVGRRISIFGSADSISGTFDLVFCHHVIEHIPDLDLPSFVGALCGYSAPEGRIIIVTPNGLNPISHAFFMSSDRTHQRMHSPFTLAELLQPHGFEIEAVLREHPQIYDLKTFFKTAVWSVFAAVLKLGLLAHASGVRGLRHPFTMASSFYVVAKMSGKVS